MPTRDEFNRIINAFESLKNGPIHNSMTLREIDLARELVTRQLAGVPINKAVSLALLEEAIAGLTHHGASYEDLALEVWSQWEVITEMREIVGERGDIFLNMFYNASSGIREAREEIVQAVDVITDDIAMERRPHAEIGGREQSGPRTGSLRRRCRTGCPRVPGHGGEFDRDGTCSVRERDAGGDLRDGEREDAGDGGSEGGGGEY
jgi:hypothetical protein